MKKSYLFFPLLFASVLVFAQKNNANVRYQIKKANSALKIDAQIDEPAWTTAQIASDFVMVQPVDTSKATVRTDVRMTYDDKNLYLLVENYEKVSANVVIESLRRDFAFNKNDNFLIFFDTFNDQLNGYAFGSNAAGAQWDALLYEGGKADLSWDNKWASAVLHDGKKWIFEAAIPFRTLRYKQGIKEWGVNFSRLDLKANEKSAWAKVPRQFPTASLAYTGVLEWDAPPPSTGANISVIPYVLGGFSQTGNENNYRKDVGFDAKFALSSAVNLDVTVNPDFSQVEVDRQQINLDRFELLFPERRQFFIENGDLFANFGYQTIRPFFSRRIGLGVPIQYGARLSGRLNKNWRLGAMDMQTAEQGETPLQNFGVFTLQRRVFTRSNISAMLVNKQSLGDFDATKTNSFNRNVGLEYNLASANNLWSGKLLYMRSFSPNNNTKNGVTAGNLQYTGKNWTYGVQFEQVGANYNAEVGYVPRKDYLFGSQSVGYTHFVKSKKIISHGWSGSTRFYFDANGKQTESLKVGTYRVNFLNRSEFFIWAARDYVKLLQDFDPTNYTKDRLKKGTEHTWDAWGTEFVSTPQSRFSYSFSTRNGGFYTEDGKRLRLGGEAGYRWQPYLALSLSANYNRLHFGENATLPTAFQNKSYEFWLLGPRVDVTFTNNLYWTTFVQYNNQANNLNLNTRLQWRYKPASDIFLVYTDNYLADSFKGVNRFLVFKMTYWWSA